MAAILIQMLRANKTLLNSSEGRRTYKLCRDHIRGTIWESTLYPENQTREWIAVKRDIDKKLDDFFDEFSSEIGLPYSYEDAVSTIHERKVKSREIA